jgi:hypothetical protein
MSGLRLTPDRVCEYCGKRFNRYRYQGRIEDRGAFMRRKFCSLPCANRRKQVGRQGWLWRARRFRSKACGACGIRIRLQVHHADGDITNLSPANLQTLCVWCHRFLHHTAARLGRVVPGKLASPVWRSV